MPKTLITDWRELANRCEDGLEVRLWWSRSARRVQVTAADHRRGNHVVFEVEGADALDAFRHPFAYASRAGRPQHLRRRGDLALAQRREQQ